MDLKNRLDPNARLGLRLTLQSAVIVALVLYLGWTVQILWGGGA